MTEHYCFDKCCQMGILTVAKLIVYLFPNTINSDENDLDLNFIIICLSGQLKVAQWLLQISKERGRDINISSNNESAFRYACSNGHLHVAQWLLQIKPDINIDDGVAFRWACYYGHLDVCQWLYQVSKERGQTINISEYYHFIFYNVCKKGHLLVAQWIQSLRPHLYVINYDETGKYKSCYVRTEEEEIWEKKKYLLWLASDCKEDNLLYRLPTDITKMVIGYV